VFVVGGLGYLGSRVASLAEDAGERVVVVGREGGTVRGRSSLGWADLLAILDGARGGAESLVWLLDGAKHQELDRLRELLPRAPKQTHVVFVSTCTVYGDAGGALCDEGRPLDVRTPHAQPKADGERLLAESGLSWCVQRLGALYGLDDRAVRADRVEQWVTSAATTGVVTVPDPSHWRGWLHREQGARALLGAVRGHVEGVFNVAGANLTFGQAAGLAAEPFGATVEADSSDDACDYHVDSSRARAIGLLDDEPGEDLAGVVRAFVRDRYPDAVRHTL
jgi:nucleoside-diphosphate-sugar epimerase